MYPRSDVAEVHVHAQHAGSVVVNLVGAGHHLARRFLGTGAGDGLVGDHRDRAGGDLAARGGGAGDDGLAGGHRGHLAVGIDGGDRFVAAGP